MWMILTSLNWITQKILKLADNNAFYIKYLLEKKDTRSITWYTPLQPSQIRDNWLLDIVKYSMGFQPTRQFLLCGFGSKGPVFKKHF